MLRPEVKLIIYIYQYEEKNASVPVSAVAPALIAECLFATLCPPVFLLFCRFSVHHHQSEIGGDVMKPVKSERESPLALRTHVCHQ